MQSKRTSLALFGGSFDPPHLAHTELIRKIPTYLNVDKILVIPTKQSPLKEKASAWEDRMDLLKKSLENLNIPTEIEISELELEISPPNTTLRLLEYLEKMGHQTKDYWFCMGQDCWEQFPKWDRWELILKKIKVAVFKRVDSKNPEKTFPPKLSIDFENKLRSIEPIELRFFDCDLPDISSSNLKESILSRDTESMKKFLPEGVFSLIQDRGLYKNTSKSVGPN